MLLFCIYVIIYKKDKKEIVIKGEETKMTTENLNIFYAIGIVLTFISSIITTIVSIISLKSSNKKSEQSLYSSTITSSRGKWTTSMRDNASLYFTQITRICSEQEDNPLEIYNELTRYHFSILMLLSDEDKKLHDNMSAIRSKAFEIVHQNSIIEQQYNIYGNTCAAAQIEKHTTVINARNEIKNLRWSILKEYQSKVFEEICFLIQREWERQKYEATNMWNKKQ